MIKPDMLAELAEVVRLLDAAEGAKDDMCLEKLRAISACGLFLRAHHAEIEAMARDAKLWRDFTKSVGDEQLVEASKKFGDTQGILRDAARYRWLREHQFSFTHDQHERGIATTRWGEWVDIDDADSLDLCIDTVMHDGADGDRVREAMHNSAREGL